jgi:hypothetical protein
VRAGCDVVAVGHDLAAASPTSAVACAGVWWVAGARGVSGEAAELFYDSRPPSELAHWDASV